MATAPATRIGVLALQGGVREHVRALRAADPAVEVVEVRTPAELAGVRGLILPGGESGVIEKLARLFGLWEPLRAALAGGLPAYGTCAGLILLADEILDASPGQRGLGGMDIAVRRNAFGSQADSFETELAFASLAEPVAATLIRAPVIERHGPGVRVLARLRDGRAVAAQQGHLMGTSFHPEVTGDPRVHQHFVRLVRAHWDPSLPSA